MNITFQRLNNLAGWLVFGVSGLVLALAAEPTGSLWDCGEFISGAYKLQVVHPPGAPVFLLIGRLFAWVATLLSDNPSNIAYAVNLLSALSTAFMGMFVCWITTILSKLLLVGREGEPGIDTRLVILASGVVAGLSAAFCSSVWFSAVEGEVYAMSTFFTAMTLWAVVKWYALPESSLSDRWLVFAIFSIALSIGVHLLSLLTLPALALFYYFKKVERVTFLGTVSAGIVGVLSILLIQKIIIAGIPTMWAWFDKLLVNSFGMPFYSGIIPVILVFTVGIWFGLRYARRTGNGLMQRLVVSFGLIVIAYMCYGMVIIRAISNPPINMNNPSDPMRLLPYLNREQYGERPLLSGPDFDAQPVGVKSEERYGRVGDGYEVVDEKVDYEFSPSDKTFFPRMGDYTQDRPRLYREWIDKPNGKITFADNLEFFWKYQIGWMYWRYFMWNFAGRQNGEQGYYSWDPSAGHWISGFSFLDEPKIGKQQGLPDAQRAGQARNVYYLIPFLLGLFGLFFHYTRKSKDFIALFAMFVITGIGIIVYSNQPPNEPRERDYVLAGSFFTYSIWIGLGVTALFGWLSERISGKRILLGVSAGVIGLAAPLLMLTQNWDDHSRAGHFASRDYARNFLESCEQNAIIFTYGDNDTYPLWYCQETEGIRTDVRVVNLSLIAVDWYIDQLRRAVNNSPGIEMSIPQDKIRGYKRVQIPYNDTQGVEREMSLNDVVKFLGEDHPVNQSEGRGFETYLPTRKMFLAVNKQTALTSGVITERDSQVVDTIRFNLGSKKTYIIKDDLAILDIIASNIWKRPIYWAVTCREEKLMGLQDYMQLEGLSLRLTPVKTKSSPESYGIIGSGRVATDLAYRNMMEKWQWGNFNKGRTFVDRSYLPSLQTMRVSMIRVGRQLISEGKKEQALKLADKYFEVFPRHNFPYDQFTAFVADIYARGGEKIKAAEKLRQVSETIIQQLRFINSQTPRFQGGYKSDEGYALGTANTVLRIAEDMDDAALAKELSDLFSPYLSNQGLPGGIPGR
jgi:hypothetical protein